MKKHLWVQVCLVVLACATSAGCERPARTARAAEPGDSDVNPVRRDRLRDGGTLRIAQNEFRTQWNLHHVSGMHVETGRVVRAVMPVLFRSGADGAVRINSHYLRGARVLRTRPRQVVRYELDSRARWSDGTPLSYRDFVANWQAVSARDGRFQSASPPGWDRILSVGRGKTDRHVLVTFARPFGEWRSLFSPLYPAGHFGTPGSFNRGWTGKMPATAGPFRLGSVDRTAQTVTLERDPRWWGPTARMERIVFRTLSPEAEVSAFADGEIDSFDIGSDAAAYRRALAVRRAVVRRAAGPDFTHLTFNGARMSEPAVRQAIALALNRAVLTRAALRDLDWPVRTLGNHVFIHGQQGYRDNSGLTGRFDFARAERMLDGAGWKRTGRYRTRAGRELRVRFVYGASTPVDKVLGELTHAMLEKIGVRVELQGVPAGDLFDKHVIPGNFDIVPFTWGGTPYPYSGLASVYGRPSRRGTGQNFARVGSPRLDRLLDRTVRELDPSKARMLANEADKLIWDEVHTHALYQRPQLTAVRNDIANWGSFGLADPVYEDIGFTR